MPMISGETKLFGLLSQGANFTLSPAMHNHAAQLFGKDLVYVNFDLAPEKVAGFLDVFWHLGGKGLNITMPHKNLVGSLVQSDGLESVNTIVRSVDGWRGYSTDGEGFLRSLENENIKINDFDAVIILGSGGSAQAVLSSIAKATTDRALPTIILRRSKTNDAKLLAAAAAGPVQILTFRSMTPESFADTMQATSDMRRLVIQATSAPKNGDSLKDYSIGLDFFTMQDFFVDLIYDRPSDLYFTAIARNFRCMDGLGMLIEQARLSQKLWWGKAASYEEMKSAIKKSGWQG